MGGKTIVRGAEEMNALCINITNIRDIQEDVNQDYITTECGLKIPYLAVDHVALDKKQNHVYVKGQKGVGFNVEIKEMEAMGEFLNKYLPW